jgi:hypothetical protein
MPSRAARASVAKREGRLCTGGVRGVSATPRGVSLGHVVRELAHEHGDRVRRKSVLHEKRFIVAGRLQAEHHGAAELLERHALMRVGLARGPARVFRGAVVGDVQLEQLVQRGA